MQTYDSELFLQYHSLLGEGPTWDYRTNTLYWIDSVGCKVFARQWGSDETKELNTPGPIGSMTLTERGDAIVGLSEGIARMDLETGEVRYVCDPEADEETNRFNDGKADPAGRLFIGSMSTVGTDGSGLMPEPTGNLFMLSGEDFQCKHLLDGITNSNGLAWNEEKGMFYYIDSGKQEVQQFRYDKETGALTDHKLCFAIPEEVGMPDGMTIDEEGMLWVALWNGSAVGRWNPDTGERIGKVTTSVQYPSSCTFGGPDMDTLFITSAAVMTSGIAWADQPEAGGLFTCKPGVKGAKTYYYKG